MPPERTELEFERGRLVMSQVKVGIINVTGYAGVELARLLYKHPRVKLCSVTGRSAAGSGTTGG